MDASLVITRWDLSGNPVVDSRLQDTENVGMRWTLDALGLVRAEIVVHDTTQGIYDRYTEHLGHAISFMSDYFGHQILGFIYEVQQVDSNRARYIIKGIPRRLRDKLNTTAYSELTTIASGITDILGNHTDVISTNYSNFVSRLEVLDGWQTKVPEGTQSIVALKELIEKANSTGTLFDLWFRYPLWTLGNDTEDLAVTYYYDRDTTEVILPTWVIDRESIRQVNLARSIENVVTDVSVFYGTFNGTYSGPTRGDNISGTHDGASGSATLIDSTADFKRDGVRSGDIILNTTDSSAGTVSSATATVVTLTDVGLEGGTDNDFDASDSYTIRTRAITGTATAGSGDITLTDASATFLTDFVVPGNTVINHTDSSRSTVSRVVSETELELAFTLSGGTLDDWTVTDEYYIYLEPIIVTDSFDMAEIGAAPGDGVVNITDGSRGRINRVYGSLLVLDGLRGGTDNRFDASDKFSLTVTTPSIARTSDTFSAGTAKGSTIEVNYWDVERADTRKDMSESQARDFAHSIIVGDPSQVQSFIVSAPTISDSNGAAWPLWEMICQGAGFLVVRDLQPFETSFNLRDLDNETRFRITYLDYDHSSGSIRIGVDTVDSRLDSVLNRAGLLNSEMIRRKTRSVLSEQHLS